MTPGFSRLLVPLDFSAQSDAALQCALGLADEFGASIHLLHVIDDQFATGPVGSELDFAAMSHLRTTVMSDVARRLIRRVPADERARFDVSTHVVHGRAGYAIVDFARDRRLDLIVMGTHGRTGIAHLLTGSIAQHVVRTAPCPVLTVPPAAAARQIVAAFESPEALPGGY